MNPEGTIFLNGDDDKLCSFQPSNGLDPVYFGLNPSCPFHAEDITDRGMEGTDALFITPSHRFRAHISIPGDHMVYNALAGIAVGSAMGLTEEEMILGIESLLPIAGRNNLIRTARFSIIDDCYNANPASMKSSLAVLSRSDTRTAAVLGDMFELGPTEKEMHYEIGKYAAEQKISVLICIGSLSSEMARGAEENAAGDMKIYHFPSKEAFFRNMDQILQTGDTILVKASHGMEFPEIVDRLRKEETKS